MSELFRLRGSEGYGACDDERPLVGVYDPTVLVTCHRHVTQDAPTQFSKR